MEGLTRIGIFALDDVRRGEEICYDYQVHAAVPMTQRRVDTPLTSHVPWQFFTSEATRCGCGAPTCRGYLGANVARDKAEEQEEAAAAAAASGGRKAKRQR